MGNLRNQALIIVAATASLLLGSCGERSDAPPEAPGSEPAGGQPTPVEPAATATPSATPSPTAASGQAVPSRLRAVGTEPFWAARVEGGRLSYMTPDYPEGFTVDAQRRPAGAGVEFSATIDGKPLVMTVAPGTCSDGMSDHVYPFTVVRSIGPDTQRGCARPL